MNDRQRLYLTFGVLGCLIVFVVGLNVWGSNQEVQDFCRDEFSETLAEVYLDLLEFYMKEEQQLIYCCYKAPGAFKNTERCKLYEKKNSDDMFDSRRFNLSLGVN